MVDAAELLRLRWSAHLTRSAEGAPLVPPLFVAEQGPAVQVADIRPRDEATGALGYVPGSAFAGVERLEGLVGDTPGASPLVLVSATGDDAASAARRLEELGRKNVAAMAGGVAAWRALGLSISRDVAGVLEELPPAPVRSASGPLTLERVREHVGDPRAVRWIKLTSMVAHGRLSCIDGRDERGVIGSPGGDGGEFLLGLAAIERVTGRTLDEDTVARGLLARLDTFGHFYMHTDVHAFEVFTATLKADPRFQGTVSDLKRPEEWAGFLRTPPPKLQDALLEHLVEPAHVGCGHIRLMLQHSDEYGIRKEQVLAFLRAFYRLWWEGTPEMDLTTLPGDHGEGAVVNIRLDEEPWGLSRIPLISPACSGQQMFVNHPDVSTALRRAAVQSLARGGGPLSVEPSQEGALQQAVEELAASQMGTTAGYLAKGLPVFEVVFAGDGAFDVREG